MQSQSNERFSSAAVAAFLNSRPWLPPVVAVIPVALARFLYHLCIQWAAALAYYTLIGLVPLLAALFALMKGVGFHRELTPFVMNTIGAGSPEMAEQIIDFIDRTNVRAVAVFSAIGAFLTVFGIMTNAEMCFNSIWGGVRGRPLRKKLRSFTTVAVIAPLLLLLALAITAFLRPGQRSYDFLDSWYLGDAVQVLLRILPYALLWVSFTLLYTALPNTTVHPRSAVIGAVVAGTLWQFAQWTYVTFVIRLVRYSAVYGALWQIPILLAWVYIAWCVILFGAEVSRAHQEIYALRLTQKEESPIVNQAAGAGTLGVADQEEETGQ